jgi:hypothetical protein
MSPQRRRRSSTRASQRRRGSGARAFWGVDAPEPSPLPVIVPTAHPNALVESLGALPFPGGRVAQHYFDAVYDRASGLAVALATAAGLTELYRPPAASSDEAATDTDTDHHEDHEGAR